MKRELKKLIFLFRGLTLLVCLFITACSGGGGGSSTKQDTTVNPSTNADGAGTTTDLASQVVNTFSDNGIDLAADPTYLDFGTTAQYSKVEKTVTITNSSSQSLTLTLSFYGTSGGFRMIDTGSFIAYKPDFTIATGETQSFTIQYDASILGYSHGYIEVIDSASSYTLHIPFQGTVSSASDFTVISASDMCSNSDAAQLSKLDFMKVASGRYKDKSFKICNTGSADLTINAISFSASTNGATSASISDVIDDTNMSVTETLNSAITSYYNPSQTISFSAPTTIAYTGTSPNASSAFGITEDSTKKNPKGIIIPAGSYALFNVRFMPNLNIEAPAGELYEPVSIATDMTIDTGLGDLQVDVVGATAGKEPILQISAAPEGSTTATVLDDSAGAAIQFGTASIFEDWIAEDTKDVTLTFKNIGSGSQNLQVWAEELKSGYFTFVQESPEKTFPIELSQDESATLRLRYAPTPTDGLATSNYDMGQLVLDQTGGNGPQNKISLYGEETSAAAVVVYQDASKLKNSTANSDGSNPYSSTKPKSFCAVKIGGSVSKKFTITNNSSRYKLTSSLSVTSLTDSTGATVNASAKLSKSTLTINSGTASTFNMTLTAGTNVVVGTTVYGELRITNDYDTSAEATYGKKPSSYDIYFSATASATGECTGGSGQPLDGDATLVVDRITMILNGISEPARNPPAFKMHIPIKLYKSHGYATIGELPFDPINSDPNSSDVFKPYNHQMTNENLCFALPNVYRQESQEGSYMAPANCGTYTSTTDSSITVNGTEACMAANKPTLETDAATGKQYYVFYHEFLKRNPDTCAVEIEGKIATFYLQQNSDGTWQSIKEVFTDMADQVGEDGSASQYQSFLHTFQFGSFIKFDANYSKGDCTHAAGDNLDGAAQSDSIAKCWDAFGADTNMRRVHEFYDECSYFFFDVKPGCVPPDVPWKSDVPADQFCSADKGSTYSDPDTWIGFGEYEPHTDLGTGEQDDTKWDFTFRNVHLEGSFVVNSLGAFFSNYAKILFADLYSTITTKAIGYDDSNWDDLIAVNDRASLTKADVQLSINDNETTSKWTADGINSEFTTGEHDGTGDDRPCFQSDGITPSPDVQPGSSCRGNFVVNGSKINPAGEPADFVNNNRFLIVGLGVFQGPLSRGQLAPSFAQEVNGIGKALVFTLHGCMVDSAGVTDDTGCYAGHIDDVDQDGNEIPNLLQRYQSAGVPGILSAEDVSNAQSDDPEVQALSKAWINFRIFNQDRDRLTDYYDTSNFYFEKDWYTSTPCGYGM